MVDAKQFRRLIVMPVLQEIGLWSQDAENLVMGTAAQESRLTYIKQLGNGPALGFFQMEPATHDDIWRHYLHYNKGWTENMLDLALTRKDGIPRADEMVWNLRYAVAMCRIHYRRKPGAIPRTVEGMADYWKQYYNTPLGKGTAVEFIKHYALVA
jgi:hypothetical protein